MAYSHGVFPLVYNVLKKYDDLIAFDKLSYMKQTYMDIVKQNMLMTSELIRILSIFKENDIESIPFKGPVLSELAYGDVISRQYVDLDILIKEKDLKIAYELLEANDFLPIVEKEFINNKLFLEKNSDITFVNKENGINIEIHWKLFRTKFSSNLNNKNFFDTKYRIIINSYNISIFSPELLLVYLCMHGSKHRWERIEWITDIDRLLKREKSINWELVYQIANSYNCTKMLNLGLYITKVLYSISIPEKYLKEFKKQTYQNMIVYILKRMIKINEYEGEINRNFASVKFHYHLNETFYEKIKYLKKIYFDISDNDTKSFNSNSLLVHYIIKPFRLLRKYL